MWLTAIYVPSHFLPCHPSQARSTCLHPNPLENKLETTHRTPLLPRPFLRRNGQWWRKRERAHPNMDPFLSTEPTNTNRSSLPETGQTQPTYQCFKDPSP
eukprot:TRINITY_DN47528_c0_g1_i1.p2 TRINITY_DN47528_c0_g1~~TRINITY_DN47528_c0_g1_i1.p2  ORF type:complete len:100 (+),score=13.48 TRINITY_DN47528_c0_g1_i1:476-775(+)